ncbi:hypothetical protein QAD02_004848 [Eretmocerus hayati]|uniref:Uncharacterized protein n=1 Tax=Eretmocerus hayati TaxID=131215 RepID=A0ACC2NSL8_9HYME|nr:hypothetical protein QAD02_004848 [Eretmocerus hayati]
MATSCEDSDDGSSSAAPADFQLSSEPDDDNDRLQDPLKCPLCHNGRRIFYCCRCIREGDFAHSMYKDIRGAGLLDRFADKQSRLTRLKSHRNLLEEKCTKALEKHRQRDKLICDIKACKERVRLLQQIENDKKNSISEESQRLCALKELNTKAVLDLPKQEERIEKLRKHVDNMRTKQQKQKDYLELKRQEWKKLKRKIIENLIQYVFPLSVVEPRKSYLDDGSSTDTITCALADASGTSYVRGKWINDNENSLELQHCIVAPTLPGSGDYSAYSLWIAENKDCVPSGNKENVMHNPAYNITAALAYATQLVIVLAYLLNVRLPYKLAYGEFYASEMSDHKFVRKVAKLNSNILYLCFTQNTSTTVLHPLHTLQNLMHLLNTDISDLGRIGSIEVDPNVITNLHNRLLPDLEISDDSASDEEEDAFNWEWEAVPNIACPEMPVPVPGVMSRQSSSSSMQVNQSVAGGLVTSAAHSIASIWRGWTANR